MSTVLIPLLQRRLATLLSRYHPCRHRLMMYRKNYHLSMSTRIIKKDELQSLVAEEEVEEE
jgi:hypothetical protein